MYVLTAFTCCSCYLLGVFSTAEKLKTALSDINSELPDAFEAVANGDCPYSDHVCFRSDSDDAAVDYEVIRIFCDTLLPARKVVLYAE